MHAGKILSALLLATLATTTSAAAASRASTPAPQLFERESSAQPPETKKLALDAVEEFPIKLDPATVAANPPVLTIDLPGFPPLEAVRTRFVEYKPDWKSWIGTLRAIGAKGKGKGYIHLGYHGDHVTALIDFEGQHYRITSDREKGQRLSRLSEDLSPPSCGMDVPADPLETLPVPEASSQESPSERILNKAEAPLGLQTEAVGISRIDVLAVYPKEFFTASYSTELALRTFIQDSISLANDAFVNSGIDAFYYLVGIVPVTGSSQPTNGLFSSLSWITGNPNPPQEVADLRNAFGADIVTLFVPSTWSANDYCGAANQPLSNASNGTPRFYRGDVIVDAAMGDRAFSAQRYNCGKQDFTMGHEMGHNYGMGHSDFGDGSTPDIWLYPSARGKLLNFSDGTTKATVMACHCTGCFCTGTCMLGSGAVCNRIPYFSDPARLYNGVATGDADRNNTAVGRNRVATYAGFRTQSTNTPPTASFTVSCAGRTCTFTSTSTDDAAIPSTGYWWDFGDGQTATGNPYTYTYATDPVSSFAAHLVVKDSGGQTGAARNAADPQTFHEGYHEVSTCNSISGWAWDSTPNDPISVDIYRDGTQVSTVAANLFRQDLLNAGKGNGSHAFQHTPNSGWKDGVWHTSVVRYGGMGMNLSTTSRNLICNVAAFTNTAGPTENLSTGGQVYTVATRFSSTHSGYITQLGFHRASGEMGSNTLRLWTDGGVQLASVTTSCTSAGWCWGSISPVAINANTSYRVSVNTNTYQSKTGCGLSSPITNGPLTAHQGYWVAGTSLPTSSGSCNSNFYVDVKFDL